jgi:hypothetical protein
MGPLTSLPPYLFLNALATRDHIHGMDKPIDPLGLRGILRKSSVVIKRRCVPKDPQYPYISWLVQSWQWARSAPI